MKVVKIIFFNITIQNIISLRTWYVRTEYTVHYFSAHAVPYEKIPFQYGCKKV